jgi:hypothetical protein
LRYEVPFAIRYFVNDCRKGEVFEGAGKLKLELQHKLKLELQHKLKLELQRKLKLELQLMQIIALDCELR